jgi:hypothetical protein
MVDYVHTYGGNTKVSQQGIREAKTAATTVPGNVKPLAFGKEVLYAHVNGSIGQGAMVMSPAPTAGLLNKTLASGSNTTVAIGKKEVVITTGCAAITSNALKNGILMVESGTGAGYSYLIAGNPAKSTTSETIKITLKDGLEAALSTASVINVIPNKAMNAIIGNATLTGPVLGVTLCSASAGDYIYVGKRGEWPVLATAAIAKDVQVTAVGAEGGIGAVQYNSAATTKVPVGSTRTSAAAGGYAICDFKL